MKTLKRLTAVIALILSVCFLFASCEIPLPTESDYGAESITQTPKDTSPDKFDLSAVPEYSGKAYVAVNSNKPYFTGSDVTTKPFEKYSSLDSLGRCGVAYANICKEIMPTEKRGEIYSVKPTGWQHVEYDFVDGLSLYNRCHLIAHSLAGEDANEKNLITGTRYLNTEGMLPFENMVGDYVKETENHVLYRVTPVFEGANLIATGVLMEGYSVEDGGDGIEFCVFCYNLQPGVEIDYSNGKSRAAEKKNSYSFSSDDVTATYVLNEKTKKFHTPDCSYIADIAKENRKTVTCRRGDLVDQGYVACGGCKP
ncbi:MAG: DNA/RNA non-specific endonuclease [Clostridia bacterium]|nr:DNA/RNA non-specific endonuclease [Clostridia bacterium]